MYFGENSFLRFLTLEFEDMSFFEDEEDLQKKKTKRNFRRDDGKCIFGAISSLNNTWANEIQIQTGT